MLLAIRLAPGQEDFVGPFSEWPEDARDPAHLHVIDAGVGPVGFFRIDPAFHARIPTLPPGSHGLRGLLIDRDHQGRGLGARALRALPDHIRRSYPGLGRLWLTVDAPNTLAHALYLRTGWVRGGPDVAGRDGLEHLLRLDL